MRRFIGGVFGIVSMLVFSAQAQAASIAAGRFDPHAVQDVQYHPYYHHHWHHRHHWHHWHHAPIVVINPRG